jgi:two-component system cell cycle sensor histidine kinase/response regulator CckA
MPDMSGKETFARLKEIEPNVRVIISTGYSNRAMEDTPWRNAVEAFLQKPYQIEELSKTIRLVLDGDHASPVR